MKNIFGKTPNLKVQTFKCYCGNEWTEETILAPNPEGYIEKECGKHESSITETPENFLE